MFGVRSSYCVMSPHCSFLCAITRANSRRAARVARPRLPARCASRSRSCSAASSPSSVAPEAVQPQESNAMTLRSLLVSLFSSLSLSTSAASHSVGLCCCATARLPAHISFLCTAYLLIGIAGRGGEGGEGLTFINLPSSNGNFTQGFGELSAEWPLSPSGPVDPQSKFLRAAYAHRSINFCFSHTD